MKPEGWPQMVVIFVAGKGAQGWGIFGTPELNLEQKGHSEPDSPEQRSLGFLMGLPAGISSIVHLQHLVRH